MRRSADFADTVRGGARRARGRITVHVKKTHQGDSALVGFVVPKSVGSAPTRNLVKRRLRAIMGEQVGTLAGWRVVVRAAPGAQLVSFAQLRQDVRGALGAATEEKGVMAR